MPLDAPQKPRVRVPALSAELNLLRVYLVAANIKHSIEGAALVVQTRDDAEYRAIGQLWGRALREVVEGVYGVRITGAVMAGKSTLVREAGVEFVGGIIADPANEQETLIHGRSGNGRQIILADASRLGAFTFGAYFEQPLARPDEPTLIVQEHPDKDMRFMLEKSGWRGWDMDISITCPEGNPWADGRTIRFQKPAPTSPVAA